MQKDSASDGSIVKAKVVLRLEKYSDGVSLEDINCGRAEPYEVLVSEDDLTIDEA